MTTAAEDDDEVGGLFDVPDDYYQDEKQPTFASHTTKDGKRIELRLVGSSPLWGHLLWQAGKVISTYLEDNARDLIHDRNILELGAGAGLPSIVCAINRAKQVVVTDYPDSDLIDNLAYNIKVNTDLLPSPETPNIVAEPLLWGATSQPLLSRLNAPSARFDTLILADILFNHSQHQALLRSMRQTMAATPDARALVFFTPYRPWLYEKDMAFFDLARESGFLVEKVLEHVMIEAMFPSDPGDETLRRTVFGYAVRWGEHAAHR